MYEYQVLRDKGAGGGEEPSHPLPKAYSAATAGRIILETIEAYLPHRTESPSYGCLMG